MCDGVWNVDVVVVGYGGVFGCVVVVGIGV